MLKILKTKKIYKKNIIKKKKYVKINCNHILNLCKFKRNSNYYFIIYFKYKYNKKFKISTSQYLRNKSSFLLKKNSIIIRLSLKKKRIKRTFFLKKQNNIKNKNLQTCKRSYLLKFIRKKKRKLYLCTYFKRFLIYKIIKQKRILFKYREKCLNLRRIHLNKYLIKKFLQKNIGVSELGFLDKIKKIIVKFQKKYKLFLKPKKKNLVLNKIFNKNTCLNFLRYLRNARLFNYLQRRYFRFNKKSKKKKSLISFWNLKKFNTLINLKKRKIRELKKQIKNKRIFHKKLKKKYKILFNYFFNIKKIIKVLNLNNYKFKQKIYNKSYLKKYNNKFYYYLKRFIIINKLLNYKKYFQKIHFRLNSKKFNNYARFLTRNRRLFQIKIRNSKLERYHKKNKLIKFKLKFKEFFVKTYSKQFNILLKKNFFFNKVLKKKKINIGLTFKEYNKNLKLLTNVKKLIIFNFIVLIQFLKITQLFPKVIQKMMKDFKNLLIYTYFKNILNLSFLNLNFKNFTTNLNLKMINLMLNCKWLKRKLYTRLKLKLLTKSFKFKIVNNDRNYNLILPRIQYKFIEMKSYFKIYRKLKQRLNKKGHKKKAMYLLFNKLSEIFIYKIRKLKSNKYYKSIQKSKLPKVGLFLLKYLKKNMFITLLNKTTNKVLGSTSARKIDVEKKKIEQEESLLKSTTNYFNIKINTGDSIKKPFYRINVLINLLEAVKNFGYGIIDLQLNIRYKKRFLLRLLKFSTVQYVGFIRLIQIAAQKPHGFLRKRKKRRI